MIRFVQLPGPEVRQDPMLDGDPKEDTGIGNVHILLARKSQYSGASGAGSLNQARQLHDLKCTDADSFLGFDQNP